MSAVSALLRGRTAAVALMLDTITVTRLDPTATTTDGETGVVTKVYTTVYTGPGKIQRTPRASRVQPATVGEAEVFMSRLELHLPITAVGITADDIATVTASQLDPDLVGKVFHIRELAVKTLQTARRFGIELVAS
jgi:Family of unknown function (DUF6093)